MPRFDLDIKGDKEAVKHLEHLESRAANIKPIFEKVGQIMQMGVKRTWHTQGGYIDKPWSQLAAATLERKLREGKPAGILQARGKLEASTTAKPFISIAKTQVRVGVKDFKARFHQGGSSPRLPARPIVGLADHDRQSIFRVVLDHFELRK